MASGTRTDSIDYRVELLSPTAAVAVADTATGGGTGLRLPSWRLSVNELKLPKQVNDPNHGLGHFLKTIRRQRRIREYYKKQERLLQGLNEMEASVDNDINGRFSTEDEMKQVAKREKAAIHVSNIANMVLFAAKVYASVQSRSMAVIASTLDSLLDLLSGFILWFTAHAMKQTNPHLYPIGKERMQPVGIVVFASVMATFGLQILFESGRELVMQSQPEMDPQKERWMIGIMVSVTAVKFVLMFYCSKFKNEIIRAYAKDHLFDVVTNSIGLAAAVLAIRFYWWIDPIGAILIALYTMNSWARTVMENVGSLIGRTAPAEYIAKLTYLIWNHHQEIQHTATVRAYKCGQSYIVEADIVLPADMSLNMAHDIGETLEEKLELLPDVERAFVHVDFTNNHPPEHKPKVP